MSSPIQKPSATEESSAALSYAEDYQHFLNAANKVRPIKKGTLMPEVYLYPKGRINEEISSRAALAGNHVLVATIPALGDETFKKYFSPELIRRVEQLKFLGFEKIALISKDHFQEMVEWQQKNDPNHLLTCLADPLVSLIHRLGVPQKSYAYGLTARYSLFFFKNNRREQVATFENDHIQSADMAKSVFDTFLEQIKESLPKVKQSSKINNNSNNNNNNTAKTASSIAKIPHISPLKRTRNSTRLSALGSQTDLNKLDGIKIEPKNARLKVEIPNNNNSSHSNPSAIYERSEEYVEELEANNNNSNNYYNHTQSHTTPPDSFETIIYSNDNSISN